MWIIERWIAMSPAPGTGRFALALNDRTARYRCSYRAVAATSVALFLAPAAAAAALRTSGDTSDQRLNLAR